MKSILTLFFSFTFIFLFAQNDLKIGQWESLLPFRSGRSVTQSQNFVYYGTESALLIVNKEDKTFRRVSKTNGLSSTGVANVKYHPEQKTLMVIYTDGVIDLLREDGSLTTLFFIRDFNNIVGEKKIFDVHVSGPETFLLAANYGVSEVNIVDNEFVFTTFTNELNVNGITEYQGFIYAATDEGLYRVNENNAFIDAFGQWEFIGAEAGLPADFTGRAIDAFNDKLYLGIDTTLYSLDLAGNAEVVLTDPLRPVRFISAEGENLIVSFADPNLEFNGRNYRISPTGEQTQLVFCSTRPIDAVEDQNGRVWYADSFTDFLFVSNGNCGRIEPNSPPSVRNNTLKVYNGELWVTSGGISLNSSPLLFADGFYSYIDKTWTTYNRSTVADIPDQALDFVPLAFDENGGVYAGAYYDGLVYYDRENFTYLDDENTSMNNVVQDMQRTRVGGLTFDSQGNLWVTNFLAARPISVMRTDGSWENFVCGSTKLLDVTVDDSDNKWIVTLESGSGFVVFDEVENRCKTFTSANTEMKDNNVNCITRDRDGEMWVGTQQGIIIFECGDPFSAENPCTGTVRTVEVDGIAAELLKDENVRSITIDGANRKWVGTSNGVFLLSADGREQIAYLSEDNSPLFDNVINDIAVDGDSGKVYIGTDKGIQVLRAEATTGGARNVAEPNVFPNPVRPEYNGPIAINGLATDANVKITDVNGQLIFETTALGGQAIWDGRDYNGRRAASGVYLVYSTRTDNLNDTDAVFAKILVMN